MSKPQNNDDNTPVVRLLVIGDAWRLFLDPQDLGKHQIQIRDNPLEGIHQAASATYDVVAVEVACLGGKLASALQSLRKATKSRLVLLVKMIEEPLARRLLQSDGNRTRLADDYLICPLAISGLLTICQRMGGAKAADEVAPEKAMDFLQEHIRQLERLATEDDLTGLKNRRYVWEFARQIIEHAAQEEARITLLIYDIDDFKHYNDQYGHAIGDSILKEAGVLMQRCCRSHDVVGRIGGDEFAVIFWDDPQGPESHMEGRRMSQVDHPREPIFIARRFQAALQKSELRVLGPGGRGTLTISGGLASFPDDGVTLEQLFEKADHALLEAKRSGKNRIYLVGGPSEGPDLPPNDLANE